MILYKRIKLLFLLLICMLLTADCAPTQKQFWNHRALDNSIFYLYIDNNLNSYQKEQIKKAVSMWETASNNSIKFILIDYIFGGTTWDQKFDEATGFGTYISNFNLEERELIIKREFLINKYDVPIKGTWCGFFHRIAKYTGYIAIYPEIIDVKNYYKVVAHEIGHLLGIKHIFSSGAIMFPVTPRNKELSDLDIKALCRLYNCANG